MDKDKFRPDRRPNVIWIFGDQHRAQALGYRGDRNVHTPCIDNLARNGVRFDQAVSGAPWCSPFRGSLLTGLYPHQHGVSSTPGALNPNIPTIAQTFNQAGYHTAWVGKWHVDGSNSRSHIIPPERRGGFSYWMGYENNNNQYECYIYGSETDEPRRLPGYETDSLTDLFIGHLKDHISNTGKDGKDYQPFFASLSVQPPHFPYVPPHDSRHAPQEIELRPNVPHVDWIREQAKLDLAGYYGMIENLDKNIHRITEALKEMDVDRETYLVFFSDHGDMIGSHAQWEKSSPWEESIRIPFIISTVGGPDNMNTGKSDAVINHVDIAPTTLGLCGIQVPENMVGYDYSNYCIRRDRKEYHGEPHRSDEPESAYLQQIPVKVRPQSVYRPWRGVVTRDGWKYVCTPDNDWLLHNIYEDPYEMANYCYDISYYKEKERCHELLRGWIEKTGDSFDLPKISLPVEYTGA